MTTLAPAARKARHHKHSYAQEGEDLILADLFAGRRGGCFVDVGAHHPKRFSNTYHLYRFRRWRGVNVDARPGGMRAFDRVRPEDVNVEAAVSDVEQRLTYHAFNEPALNTFDPTLAAAHAAHPPYRVLRTVSIMTTTLRRLLDRHLPAGRAIDVLSVDVEGLDLAVLRSNDWARYRPGVLLVEAGASTLAGVVGSPTTAYLAGHGYEPFAATTRTVFYRPADHAR